MQSPIDVLRIRKEALEYARDLARDDPEFAPAGFPVLSYEHLAGAVNGLGFAIELLDRQDRTATEQLRSAAGTLAAFHTETWGSAVVDMLLTVFGATDLATVPSDALSSFISRLSTITFGESPLVDFSNFAAEESGEAEPRIVRQDTESDPGDIPAPQQPVDEIEALPQVSHGTAEPLAPEPAKPKRKDQVLALYRAGITKPSEIAVALRCSSAAASTQLTALRNEGLIPKPEPKPSTEWTEEQDEMLASMYRANAPIEETAAAVSAIGPVRSGHDVYMRVSTLRKSGVDVARPDKEDAAANQDIIEPSEPQIELEEEAAPSDEASEAPPVPDMPANAAEEPEKRPQRDLRTEVMDAWIDGLHTPEAIGPAIGVKQNTVRFVLGSLRAEGRLPAASEVAGASPPGKP